VIFHYLGSLATDSSSQLDILWHDSNSLGVNGAQVSVFKETDQVSLTSFLEGTNGGALEPEISFEVLSNFSHKTLEGQLADQQLGRFLVTTNFTKSHSTGTITMGLLYSSSGRGRFTGSLGGQLFPGSLSSGRFTSSLLCTGHVELEMERNLKNIGG
jgi:histone H3